MSGEPYGLMCPACRAGMAWPTAATLVCAGCAAAYPMVEGIPVIRENDGYYHGLLPRERMRELLERTRATGWEAALARTLREEPDHRKIALRDVLLDESRAAFKILLKPLAGRRVLDLGCGSGSTSISLARWAGEVTGCDLTWERVAFLALRAQALGLDNLRVLCAGDTRPLPFPDESFDCVVLNGVLEWSAGEGERPVRDAQREFLSEVRRILRPDGQLYIGIENRLGFYYFLGQPEDHTGVRFAALAPRWLANAMVRRACGHDYRTHTYTRTGYQRLLREAGFHDARFYAPVPDYRSYSEIAALDSPAADSSPRGSGWRARVKHRLLRDRWLAPSFGIVAGARPGEAAWVTALADHVRRHLDLGHGGGFPGITVTPWSGAGIVIFLDRAAVVRVPLDPVCEERVRNNFEGLRQGRSLAALLPELDSPGPLLSATFHGVPYTVESRLAGRPYRQLPPPEQAAADRRLFEFLLRFKSTPLPVAGALAPGEAWQRFVVDPLARLEACVAQETQGVLRRLRARVEGMAGDLLPARFSHGDLWAGNVIVDAAQERIGLVDWDRWSPAHFATTDFLHFTCYRRVLRDGSTWPGAVADWLQERNVDGLEREWTERFAAALGLRNWRTAAGVAYWVREVTSHDDAKLRLDPLWTASVVDAVLPSLTAAATAAA